MATNRKISFGYMMKNGKLQANPAEVLAVVTIFSEYLAGKSLSELAKSMSVPYSEGATWNKNMVKRILENEKFIGEGGYPQLVDKKIFTAVNAKKSPKALWLTTIPDERQAVRRFTYCAECGARLSRSGGNGKYERWDCKNSECFPFKFRLTDQMLVDAVLNVLNAAIANPSLIENGGAVCEYVPTAEITRRQNEINHMLDAPQIDFDRAKAEIIALAELKFDCCKSNDNIAKTAQLREIVANNKQSNMIDIGLLKSCVTRISVSHFSAIKVEFLNGTKVKNITERSENHGANSGECYDNSCENEG